MIARIWRGRTRAEDYERYADFLRKRAIPDYRGTEGFKGLIFLRRLVADEAHFVLITFWQDLESVRNFAGDDVEKAKYYPEDRDFLLEFPERVEHFEVFAMSKA